jgi:small subunit ribosomal protein S16
MIKIRLRRTGSKKKASYRVVVAPSTAPRDGRFIENIGHYHPRQNPPLVVLKEDRLFHWLSVGAQPSDSVKQILTSQGALARFAQFKAEAVHSGGPTSEVKASATEAVAAEVEAVSTVAAPAEADKTTESA